MIGHLANKVIMKAAHSNKISWSIIESENSTQVASYYAICLHYRCFTYPSVVEYKAALSNLLDRFRGRWGQTKTTTTTTEAPSKQYKRLEEELLKLLQGIV